jgi:putative membrane protein
MPDLPRLLVFLHVAFNLVWIGAIAAVGVTLITTHGSSRDRGAIALALYRRLAVPAFLGSLMMGLMRLVLALDLYFVQTKFMHGKLLFAVGVIALHHALGGAAKRMASGKVEAAGHSGKLVVALLVCAVVTAFFAVVKPF